MMTSPARSAVPVLAPTLARALALALLVAGASIATGPGHAAEQPATGTQASSPEVAAPMATLPPADQAAVAAELKASEPSALNVRCQGFLAAVGQAARLRKDAARLMDTEKAIDALQAAIVKEAVAAAGENYSVKTRLAKGRDALKSVLPAMRDQVSRFVTLLREPSKADEQTLANQEAVCQAVVKRVAGE